MKTLQDICEGILNSSDLEAVIDKQALCDFGEWIVEYWKDAKWLQDESRSYMNWYDDRESSHQKYEDFGLAAKKKGKKWKTTRKAAEQLMHDKIEDVTIICVSYLKTGNIRHIGIGNPGRNDALMMQLVLYPPTYSAKLPDRKERLAVWCPSVMSKEPLPRTIWWQVAGDGNAQVKREYYVIPGIYWERIKNTILK